MPWQAQQVAGQGDKIATGMAILNLGGGGRQVGGDECAAQQRLEEFFHGRLGLEHAQGMHNLALFQHDLRNTFIRCRKIFTGKQQLLVVGNVELKAPPRWPVRICWR